MTLLYTDPIFLEHDTGRHPENASRLVAIGQKLDESGLASRCRQPECVPLAETDIFELHDRSMMERVRQLTTHGGGHIDGDTVVSPRSLDAALVAAGTCVAATKSVLSGEDRRALCLVRPPGHHATPHRIMGFCLFNNIALAADHARKRHGLTKILVIDWDVHHGNGTQDIFYSDGDVFFLSIHRYGFGFYPGTGAADETGTGEGLGRTKNMPIRYGTSRNDFHAAFRNALYDAADAIKPELVLVSAGFDAHAKDPIGSLGLETEDFTTLTKDVVEVANTHAGGRLVSCLEGGYNVGALAESVETHLKVLLEQ